MKKTVKAILAAALMAVVSSVYGFSLPIVGTGTELNKWSRNISGVLAAAKTTGYPIFLVMINDSSTGEGCEHCKLFVERTLNTAEFDAINESFQATFLELFGGGKASLVLEDEENVLDCGIEIRVQPPGKAVSAISLLSGGEKAFVAIALYFAILKVRPTPFCVMDEIEAALDEENVVRFAEYLHRLDKTQFIVITHRRGTMEAADVLYGVTMQEQGVSKVLTVDINQVARELNIT